MSNPAMEKKVQGLIRKVLQMARREVSKAAKEGMKGDPRQAYKAVKMAVYRQILGGNVSLLNKRKAGQRGSYTPPRKGLGPRGGNRRPRSQRTVKLDGYMGADRGFILRFLNAGTQGRYIEHFTVVRGRHEDKWNRHPNTGYRGKIGARNFFGSSSHKAMKTAAAQLTKLIDDLIKKEMK